MGFPIDVNKRQLLVRQIPAALCLAVAPGLANATTDRRLYLHNLHTQERLECWYFSNGKYVQQALLRLDHFFRDHRTGEQRSIDVDLLDTLFLLYAEFNSDQPIEIISGYRSASTNAMLRKQSSGVARYSYHMTGRAVDCRLPGVSTHLLSDAARRRARGGVGFYRRSDFVHLDTGPVRSW